MVLERHPLANVYINFWVGPTLSLRTVLGLGRRGRCWVRRGLQPHG